MTLVWLIIEGLFFLVLGLFFILIPNLYLKILKWQMEKVLKAKLTTTDETKKRIRLITLILGLIFITMTLIMVYFGFQA